MSMSCRLLLACRIARMVVRAYRWWCVSVVIAVHAVAEDNFRLSYNMD